MAAYRGNSADGSGPAAAPVPEVLRSYVDNVVRCAYRITDEDVQGLKRAGYGEDEIFEITVAAAMGAGLHRLERGLAALNGGR